MTGSAAHYRNLLSEHYSWMLGKAFEDAVAEGRKEFVDVGMDTGRKDLAVDLGCGPGHQAAALADVGFDRVLAFDTSQVLLDELIGHKGDRPIETICDDMLTLAQYVSKGSVNAIICMGDTLTHLESMNQVRDLMEACCYALRSSGRLFLTFRNYSEALKGLDRFTPVRLDADRLMTCVLDYDADHVEVTDLVYTRMGAGWDMRKSSYRKLRLAPDEVATLLRSLGLAATVVAGRMTKVMAQKP